MCVCVWGGGGGGGGGGLVTLVRGRRSGLTLVWIDTGEGGEEWIDPSLMSGLMGEDGGPLLIRAWDGWDQR